MIVVLTAVACSSALAQEKPSTKPDSGATWTFAVSGDSRNCGDVIMPAIATGAKDNKAEFYWHLGDLRATSFIDEDYLHEPEHREPAPPAQPGQNRPSPGTPGPAKTHYDKTEWDDFIQSQLNAFGTMPVYVGIGNHETYPPKSREQFIIQFADWLDTPSLRAQRLADNPNDHALKSFFHWIKNGVDFIYLDNSTKDQFDSYQMGWLEGVLERAAANSEVKTVVVGMHAALPDSLASGHSMNDWDVGTQSGRQVYADLLKLRQAGKHVYILASHSHFFMSGIFDSDYWRAHGGVLPGWIVGTAGAMRYQLPPTADRAKEARTKTYGYLLGSVRPDGAIDFTFQEVKRGDIPGSVSERFSPEFVDVCFNQNVDLRPAPAPAGQKPAAEK
jgi:hypothetical protein